MADINSEGNDDLMTDSDPIDAEIETPSPKHKKPAVKTEKVNPQKQVRPSHKKSTPAAKQKKREIVKKKQ